MDINYAEMSVKHEIIVLFLLAEPRKIVSPRSFTVTNYNTPIRIILNLANRNNLNML